MSRELKRQCELVGLRERTDLEAGMDFRRPDLRREVFHRFYEFHVMHRAHPGCVYSILPFVFDYWKMDDEARLWFCFLNGNTQHPITSAIIFEKFPSLKHLNTAELEAWFNWAYPNLDFDTDRRHHKASFVTSVKCYAELMKPSTQRAQLDQAFGTGFGLGFQWVRDHYYSFGRLSTFSYVEYLKLAGVDVRCDMLLLDDMDGSRSHRNGLCKVLGRDDLDWHHSNPGFDGKYTPEEIEWLGAEAALLLNEARARATPDRLAHTDYLTLESALCTYKSWHRPNRRYPGVYLDMFWNRLDKARRVHGKNNPKLIGMFDDWRATVPKHLRTECNAGDAGCTPEKQNHYLNTGQVIMMDVEWPCFKNDYNDRVRGFGLQL